MNVDSLEAEPQEIRRAHERLKAEHRALVEIFEPPPDRPPDLVARRAHLDRLRKHRARLQAHRAALRAS